MFPGTAHCLAALTAVPAPQTGGTGSKVSKDKQLLNNATNKMSPLEDAPRLVMQKDWNRSAGAVRRVFARAISLVLALAFGGFTRVTKLTNLAETRQAG